MIATTTAAMRNLVDRAMEGSESLSIAEQISLYEAAAYAFQRLSKEDSEIAAFAALAMREGERHQLKFRELLKRTEAAR